MVTVDPVRNTHHLDEFIHTSIYLLDGHKTVR